MVKSRALADPVFHGKWLKRCCRLLQIMKTVLKVGVSEESRASLVQRGELTLVKMAIIVHWKNLCRRRCCLVCQLEGVIAKLSGLSIQPDNYDIEIYGGESRLVKEDATPTASTLSRGCNFACSLNRETN
jgi:hypothetical protein